MRQLPCFSFHSVGHTRLVFESGQQGVLWSHPGYITPLTV